MSASSGPPKDRQAVWQHQYEEVTAHEQGGDPRWRGGCETWNLRGDRKEYRCNWPFHTYNAKGKRCCKIHAPGGAHEDLGDVDSDRSSDTDSVHSSDSSWLVPDTPPSIPLTQPDPQSDAETPPPQQKRRRLEVDLIVPAASPKRFPVQETGLIVPATALTQQCAYTLSPDRPLPTRKRCERVIDLTSPVPPARKVVRLTIECDGRKQQIVVWV